MNITHPHRRQHGVSTWTMTGSVLIVAGIAGLGIGLIKPDTQTANIVPIVTPEHKDQGPAREKVAIGDKVMQKIGPGEGLDNWSIDPNGAIHFGRQIVKAGSGPSVELRLSKGNQSGTMRYAVLVDTDNGPFEGYVWRTGAQKILARITVPHLISETIFWSPNGMHAVAMDGGSGENAFDHDHIYVINLENGRLSSRKIGPFKSGDCEMQRLEDQPASWIGDSVFRITARIEEDLMMSDPVKCPPFKARSRTVDVPLR